MPVSLGTADTVMVPISGMPFNRTWEPHLHSVKPRVPVGFADKVYRHDPIHGVIIPTLGQLWPRQMWHYNDDLLAPAGTLGYGDRIYNYFAYGIIRPAVMLGQIWPRGDYVANAESEVRSIP